MTEYLERDRARPFTAMQWNGQNRLQILQWLQEHCKTTCSAVPKTIENLGLALSVEIDGQCNSIGKGGWFAIRCGILLTFSDHTFREQYEPIRGFHSGGVLRDLAEQMRRSND